MELDTKEDLRLLDQLNKCRCCFEKFGHFEKQVEITDLIKEQFQELTQIEVRNKNHLTSMNRYFNFNNCIWFYSLNHLQSIRTMFVLNAQMNYKAFQTYD